MVGDIVAAHPRLVGLFERVGIDYCCGGKRTLAQACAAQGLDPLKATLLAVYVHGSIGDAIAAGRGPIGILASDIIERIPAALSKFVA
jgi:iron-sulfur cluster repair protein YtfE (RIC family)